MLHLKALVLLTVSIATLSSLSALSAPIPNNCDYVRRNINSRLPKGINLNRSILAEVTVKGKTTRECVVYGNDVAIRYTLADYQSLPNVGLELPIEADTLYYGYKGSYVLVKGESAIVIFTETGTARD